MHRRLVKASAVRFALATALLSAVSSLFFPTSAAAKKTSPFDAGFLATRYSDANGDQRVKAVGPFFEMAQSPQGWRLVAARPFYSEVERPESQQERRDYLWPLGSWGKTGPEEVSRYLIFFSFKHGEEKPDRRYRFWLLPFYFQGRGASGETYRAVFPFGGTIRDFIGRDEISFVLFPIHSTSKLNTLETSNWLWPLISKTTGEKVERQRVFPFYGISTREGQYKKRFVMWPIWNDVEYFYPGSSGKGFVLFPIAGHMKLEDQESWWALPPFFRYKTGDRGTYLLAPWPFIQRETGETEKLYIWPLWGHRESHGKESTFYLWPIIWNQTATRGREGEHRFMVVPFYYQLTRGVTNEPPHQREVKFWPLFSYRRVGEDSKFHTLELWPLGDSGAVERNWAPFWTIYSSARHEDSVDRELLWGLHRDQKRGKESRFWSLFPLWDWRRDADHRSWSVLKGLLGRERFGTNTEWRVLFFLKFGDTMNQETEP